MRTNRWAVFVLYQAGPMAVAGTTLVVWPLLGRVLPPADVGTLSGLLAIVSICAPVITFGLHLHLANRLARNPNRSAGSDGAVGAYWGRGLLGLAALGVIGMLIWPGNPVWQLTGITAATGATMIVLGVNRGLNRPWTYAMLTVGAQFLALLGLTLGGVATGSLQKALVAYVLLLMATAGIGLALRREKLETSRSDRLHVLAGSFRLVPHLVLAVATLLLTRLVVGAIQGPSSLAAFQYAALIIGGLTTVGASLDAHWSVRAQETSSPSELTTVLARNLRLMLLAGLLLIATVVVFSSTLLAVWLPPGYAVGAVRNAVFLSLTAGIFQALADNRSAGLMWHGRGGVVSVCTALGVAVTLGTSVLLVEVFGWQGAGLAIALGTATRAAALLIAVQRTSLRLDGRSVVWTIAAVLLALSPVLMIGK